MKLKLAIIAGAIAAMGPFTAQATTVTFDNPTLLTSAVNAGLISASVTVDGLNLDVTASGGGVVDVYTVASAPPTGIAIGAPSNGNINSDFTGNTNPSSGTYSLNFDQALTSIEVTFGFLTNRTGTSQDPGETISQFAADGFGLLASVIGFTNSGGTSFSGGVISANDGVGNGRGIFRYNGPAFSSLSFLHQQNPRNIGFIISNVSVEIAPVPLPAALPLMGAGFAALGFVGWRRKRKAA